MNKRGNAGTEKSKVNWEGCLQKQEGQTQTPVMPTRQTCALFCPKNGQRLAMMNWALETRYSGNQKTFRQLCLQAVFAALSFEFLPFTEKVIIQLGMAADAINPSTPEAGRFLSSRLAWYQEWAPGKSKLHTETLFRKPKQKSHDMYCNRSEKSLPCSE